MIETIYDSEEVRETVVKNNYSILLLEDNMFSLQEHTDILISAGYNLEYSIAGNNLTEIVYRNKFDLVLLNMVIDGVNGYDVIKRIKESPFNADTPVVLITGYQGNNDLMQGLYISGIDFLRKPYSREELLTRINNQITFSKSKQKLEQGKLIAQSLHNAERIKMAMSAPESKLEDLFADHFLINFPRDIVSGDFYWMKKHESRIIVALADCTGHGVPGAFLSILGISLLNEIYSQYSNENAGTILDHLRKKLKDTMLKGTTPYPLADGMDISLIIIDTRQMSLQFSGAFQKIIIARNSEMIELRGDLQPIGMHLSEKQFTNHQLDIEPGTRIYMTSDGYADQFGGKSQKKYQYSRYRQLISKTQHLGLQQQKTALIQEHRDWKGVNDQVDDILLMGLEIKQISDETK